MPSRHTSSDSENNSEKEKDVIVLKQESVVTTVVKDIDSEDNHSSAEKVVKDAEGITQLV